MIFSVHRTTCELRRSVNMDGEEAKRVEDFQGVTVNIRVTKGPVRVDMVVTLIA